MERKLKQANETIEHLVDALISEKSRNYDGCCLRITLLGEDRINCSNQSCYQCNCDSKMKYKEMLLRRYLVK